MKRVLVCGVTGFIGRNVAERLVLRDDYQVFGTHFSRPAPQISGLSPLRVDLNAPEEVHRAIHGMDIIIQAAATTSGAKDIVNSPYIHVTDNAVMNSLILRAAFECSVSHVVFFSCTVMYSSSDRPLKESDFNANDQIPQAYFGVGWTKVYVEKMCEFYSRLAGTKFTVIRHSNVYGPYDKFDLERSHVFGATIAKVMTSVDGKVTVWGPGTEGRDFLYVSDLVDFVELALDRQTTPYELVNVGSGSVVTVRHLVDQIIGASGKQVEVQHDLSKPNIPSSLCLDTTRAREIFGWTPATSLEAGIRTTIDFYVSKEHTSPVDSEG